MERPADPHKPLVGSALSATWSRIIGSVRSPLGFFCLSLLIVEVFLLGAGIFFDIPQRIRVYSLGVGVLLFLVVFFSVVWLVVKHPRNLVFTESSHVRFAELRIYGESADPITGFDLEGLPKIEAPDRPTGQLPPSQGRT